MDFILKAGPFLWPIVIASVIGLAIFLERAQTFLRYRSSYAELVGEVVELACTGRLMDAADACKHAGGPVASVLATLMRTLDLPKDEREQIVIVAGNREIRQMERGLRGIAVIARIAPLLGLLRTVAGLLVAIPAILSHEWLQSRVDEVALQIQEAVTEVLASVGASQNSGESHDRVPAKSTTTVEVDLTPLIDVVFQLLVFFLLTSAFVNPGITVNLPDAETGATSDDATLSISIDSAGDIFVGQEQVSFEELERRLTRQAGVDTEMTVAIWGDIDVRYGLFMRIMDLCRASGLTKIVLMVRQDRQSP